MGELKKHQPSMTIDEQVENLKAASRIKIKSMFSGFRGDKKYVWSGYKNLKNLHED